jgi:DNA-binding NarL/FixJ family response regulator
MIKVIICDDQAIVRDGLEMLLKLEKDIEVIGVAQDGVEAIELAELNAPDLMLMDLKMPGMTGVEATRRILAKNDAMKILVLTTYDDDAWVFDAIRAGASGYLLKDTPRQQVLEAIRGTVAGKSFLDPNIAGKLLVYPTFIVGYKRCNLIRASSVVNRQLIVDLEALRRFCQALIFSRSAS